MAHKKHIEISLTYAIFEYESLSNEQQSMSPFWFSISAWGRKGNHCRQHWIFYSFCSMKRKNLCYVGWCWKNPHKIGFWWQSACQWAIITSMPFSIHSMKPTHTPGEIMSKLWLFLRLFHLISHDNCDWNWNCFPFQRYRKIFLLNFSIFIILSAFPSEHRRMELMIRLDY